MSFGTSGINTTTGANKDESGEEVGSKIDKRPLWEQEEESRGCEPLKNVRFLRERGYTSSEAMAVCCSGNTSRVSALKKSTIPMVTTSHRMLLKYPKKLSKLG